ncbi:ATP-binding protein [Actinoplanes sp. LDG1-06]|uniref:ATP-binding protein n=1 Tax=Paractinoplanes ovalisporus TaxID=2810368 RepID=A0ABS2AD67_9ACTN|nr:ATP-binding protein [Actinoplanes ovalisporus]MBM2617196.1 ATP-binding protein [Actinoplanes ovalisporus]
MRSNRYPPNESADEAAEEFVAAPGHGAVGVFQSPQPVRPRGGPVDNTLDIDSPFLDLFGGAAPPSPVSSAPAAPAPAAEAEPDLDFDFGFDFDDRPTDPNGAAPVSTPPTAPAPAAPAVEPEPVAFAPTPTPVSEPPVAGPPISEPPAFEPSALEPPVAGPPIAMPSAPGPRVSDPADDRDGPWGAQEPSTPYSRAPIGPKADFFQESGAAADPDLDEWPDFDNWPENPQVSAAPATTTGPVSAAPVSTPPLWQTVGGNQARPPQAGPVEAYAPQAQPPAEIAPAEAPLPVPATEKAPAKRKEKAPARRKKEPKNLPAQRVKQPKPVALRPHKLKFNDRDPVMELEISEIAGHLTFTQSTVTAWYYLPEVRWAFRPDAEREALLSAISEQYAGLAGFRLHLRRTNRPFPADEWARTVDSFTAKPLPDVRGGISWSDHLVAAQRHLLSVNHAEGQTYLGVTFARRSLGDTFSERILRMFGRGTSDSERRKLGRTVEQFDEVLNAFGMRGRRVTPQELEWLLFRSVALCMAPPGPLSPVTNGQWDTGDLLALTEQVERYRTPYGSTVKLVNRMTGEERHVAVLSVGRMEPLEIPEKHEPWLHFHERLPWPMEISSRLDILGSGSSFKNLEHRLRMIRSQQLDYAEHGIDAPPELERLAKRALVIGDEMTTGLPVESARAHGWHRIAVGGATREECLERARRLIQLYSRELRISLQHPKNQDQLAREFIPGEPIANTGYVRRMPVKLLAAALPQAASTVGDRRGDLIGRTAGTCRRPVFLDLHFPMEVRERSGLGVFVAEPGGGKSTLMGALGYLNARRGVQVTLLDPSGPLARLCQMPELRPYSRVLNLTGSEQGTLAPYALIPTPVRSEFPTGPGGDREYEISVSNARAERRMLVQDICSMLVPPQVAKEASTATLLRHAVRQVPAEESSTLDDVVRTLQGLDDEGRELANLLLDTAEMPLALLFFGSPPQHLLGADAALTVITMAGLRLPDLKIEREYWSAEESLALPMLHTAHRLAVRRCYGGSMSSRKMVGLDEAHFMEGWRSGRSFLVRLARDSRKWNLAALVASQNPRDILGLDVQNLVSTVFVGRIAEDQEIASEALRLLRVPVHDGYEATLASLSQVDTASSSRLGFREFVMRDVDGRVQKVRVDVSYVEGLLEHLDTTPTAAKAPAIPMSPSDLEV